MLALKTAATYKKSLNLQLNFTTTFSETSKQNDTSTIKSQWYGNIRRCFNMTIIRKLSSLPLKHESFSLTKREFFDVILSSYWWELEYLPHECVCKEKYNIDHALNNWRIRYTTQQQICKCHCRYAITCMQRCKERTIIKHYSRQ